MRRFSCPRVAVSKKIRVHPIQFLRFLRPYLFILVLPTVRRAVQFLLTGSYDYFLPAEVALTVTVVCLAAFKTRHFYVTGNVNFLLFHTGKMLQKITALELSHISEAIINITPFDRIFRTATLKLRTGARLRPRPDFILSVKREDAFLLAQILGIK